MAFSQVIENAQDELTGLLGPWASAPVTEDFTFRVELEFGLHGVATKSGVDFGLGSMVPEVSERYCGVGLDWVAHWVADSVLYYLQLMGMPEGWR
jgi:hypothetical protein